jgi:hypothetical protein
MIQGLIGLVARARGIIKYVSYRNEIFAIFQLASHQVLHNQILSFLGVDGHPRFKQLCALFHRFRMQVGQFVYSNLLKRRNYFLMLNSMGILVIFWPLTFSSESRTMWEMSSMTTLSVPAVIFRDLLCLKHSKSQKLLCLEFLFCQLIAGWEFWRAVRWYSISLDMLKTIDICLPLIYSETRLVWRLEIL